MTKHLPALPGLIAFIALIIVIVEVSRTTKNTLVIVLAFGAVIVLGVELVRHIRRTYSGSREI